MKTKKLLSILLALMMMLSVVPMYASAADPIALTEANVVTWPTIEGEIYWGQKLSDGFTVVGGVVTADGTADGTVIPGKFEFINDEYVPITTSEFADLRFIPDNTQEYEGFEVENTTNVIFEVKLVTPVLVNENDVPVASSVASVNARITTSTLTGGTVKNPYTGEVISATWVWVNRRDKVAESGYFSAVCSAGLGYEPIYMDVYVSIAGDAPATKVEVNPSFVENEISYDPNITWGMLQLTGGKTVVSETGTEIAGTFAVSDEYKDKTIAVGERTLPIIFTPSDSTQGIGCVCQIPITVKPASIKFVDENGAETVPEITVPYGTKIGDVDNLLEKYAKGPEVISIGIKDCSETDVCATGTYTAILTPINDSNYEKTELPFNIIVEAKKLNPIIKVSTDGYYVQDSSGTYKVKGTFDVYVDGKLYKNGVKYLEKVAYVPETSGTHEIKFVYKPIENDSFAIENEIKDTFAINLVHKMTASENILSGYGDFAYGTAVEISANLTAENFAGWKITDAKGNEVTLDGVDNSKTTITITMPDYDIHVEALEKNATSGGSGGLGDIDFGDLSEGDSEWAIINIIRNIIAMFKSFLQQLIETFQSIGD